jgi:Uma2 family endonuclease
MCAIEYYTYQDYLQWEGEWELIGGIPLAMAPSPTIDHQVIALLLARELMEGAEACDGCVVVAEQDWKIDEETVVKPDVALICHEPGDSYITKAPRIVVEVVSPSSSRRDEKVKFELYEQERVPYYLLVYPEDLKAKIYRLAEDGYRKEGDFNRERYRFELDECRNTIDFERVFRRFRKGRS